ncbi:unnamed protein product [Caenorhabditis angaria]|uniref:Uncharacterized protein n=1 Tax=Caenorhabditis angaria TaxID=860376 RepID=A0A9P1IRN8_9PELO|nr:unnamed protein product [Caenorhabditis angaria]
MEISDSRSSDGRTGVQDEPSWHLIVKIISTRVPKLYPNRIETVQNNFLDESELTTNSSQPALSQTLIQNVSKEYGINEHTGYYSNFVIYLVFTFGHFVATPIVEIITPKWSIVSGLIGYGLYEVSYLIFNDTYMYIAGACAGFSGSLLWTGQFDYLAQNCKPETLDRNASNLWGLTQASIIFGGIYLLIIYRFQEGDDFPVPLIRLIVGSFLVCTLISIIIGIFLPAPSFKVPKREVGYIEHLGEIVKISYEKELLLLFFTFCYSGLELSFFSVVFPTMVSNTKALGKTRDLNAFCSIFIGAGNVLGCVVLAYLGPKVRTIGRHNVLIIGSLFHLAVFVMSFLTFPEVSPLSESTDQAIYPPSKYIVFISALFLGIGDTIINQQCYTILADIYEHEKRISAFAVYRFFQSASSCILMFSAAFFNLSTHLIVLSVTCILSMITFRLIKVVPQKISEQELLQ